MDVAPDLGSGGVYKISKQEQLWGIAEHAREEGFKQFLDDKTYKPGLGVYKKYTDK